MPVFLFLLALTGCIDKPSTDEGEETDSVESTTATDNTTDDPTDDTGTSARDSDTMTDTATPATGDTGDSLTPDIVTVTDVLDADLSCYVPGGTCLIMRAYEDCVRSRDVVAEVSDADGGEVSLYWEEDITESPDSVLSVDGGAVSGRVPTCTPLTWAVTGDGPTTIGVHHIFPPTEGEPTSGVFETSSAQARAALMASAELSDRAEEGVVVGTVVDCAGEPVVGVQVTSWHQKTFTPGQVSRYFSGDAPDPALTVTVDGRWMLARLPEGRHLVEIWGRVPGL